MNALGALISIGFGAGLLLSGLAHVAVYWVVVTVTIWSICIVLGNLSESLRLQVGTDHLTGLLNRTGFLAAALRERALANRTGAPLTVAVIDLDDFKQINDCAGHAAGDELLAGLGRQWRERMRPSATSSPATAAMSSCCCSPAPGPAVRRPRWSVSMQRRGPSQLVDRNQPVAAR